ncbi:MAG TPA: cation transporter [Gemmataceae bacterium]|nr:cation transporter [Gemmataceae bacterium]
MKRMQLVPFASLALVLVFTGSARTDTTVELKGVHLCCPACIKTVADTLKKVDGVTGKCDHKAKTVTITAKDNAGAQKALDALAAAGFHGDTGNKDFAMKEDSGASKGKVKSVTLTGVHNCCNACCKAIKSTVKEVKGVTGDTAKPKDGTFDVTGDFDAEDLVKALEKAGFHVKVKN